MVKMMTFNSFAEFYPYYLSEHQNTVCRRLHFVGTTVVIALILAAFFTRQWWFLALTPIAGYSFAWVGHFAFENNRPATFKHPWYSFLGDWKMFFDMLTRKIEW